MDKKLVAEQTSLIAVCDMLAEMILQGSVKGLTILIDGGEGPMQIMLAGCQVVTALGMVVVAKQELLGLAHGQGGGEE